MHHKRGQYRALVFRHGDGFSERIEVGWQTSDDDLLHPGQAAQTIRAVGGCAGCRLKEGLVNALAMSLASA
jgi:hypothetical protein